MNEVPTLSRRVLAQGVALSLVIWVVIVVTFTAVAS